MMDADTLRLRSLPSPPGLEVAVFELTQSPHGRLISFDADEAQSSVLAGFGRQARLSLQGADVAALSGHGPSLVFVGAAAAAAPWARGKAATHVLAFTRKGAPFAKLLTWE